MADRMTIKDIADKAGVSKATVSRVLNHKPDVDPETRERVLRIVEEEGFVPSPAATGLAGRSRLLGVLVPSLTWPLIPQIMRGIAEVVEQTNYELVLYSISHAQDRVAVLDRILATKLTSGLLAIFPGPAAQLVATINAQGFPVVMIDDQEQPTSAPWVGADNRTGAYLATRHLLDLGHRRIGIIRGPQHYLCAQERYEGYCRALQEAGIAPDPAFTWMGNFEVSSGRACGDQILAQAERPTAVFATNDQMAYGLLALLQERGVQVPEDLAIVGFDDIPPLFHTRVALTTVRQPFYEMGQHGMQALIELVEAPRSAPATSFATATTPRVPARPARRIQLATSLSVRESCGAQVAQPVR